MSKALPTPAQLLKEASRDPAALLRKLLIGEAIGERATVPRRRDSDRKR